MENNNFKQEKQTSPEQHPQLYQNQEGKKKQ